MHYAFLCRELNVPRLIRIGAQHQRDQCYGAYLTGVLQAQGFVPGGLFRFQISPVVMVYNFQTGPW